ncbi:peptidyl-tRNA hydrolase [Sarracenia purpurea var. burkii]
MCAGSEIHATHLLPRSGPAAVTIPSLLHHHRATSDLKLLQCINETYCLPEAPKVVYGLRASTADIFLDNAAYRKFLFSEFNVSTVDEETSAIVMTSLTNGVPCIVFRGVSDLAGGSSSWKKMKFTSSSSSAAGSLSSLAAANALNVAVEFIGLIGSPFPTHQDH